MANVDDELDLGSSFDAIEPFGLDDDGVFDDDHEAADEHNAHEGTVGDDDIATYFGSDTPKDTTRSGAAPRNRAASDDATTASAFAALLAKLEVAVDLPQQEVSPTVAAVLAPDSEIPTTSSDPVDMRVKHCEDQTADFLAAVDGLAARLREDAAAGTIIIPLAEAAPAPGITLAELDAVSAKSAALSDSLLSFIRAFPLQAPSWLFTPSPARPSVGPSAEQIAISIKALVDAFELWRRLPRHVERDGEVTDNEENDLLLDRCTRCVAALAGSALEVLHFSVTTTLKNGGQRDVVWMEDGTTTRPEDSPAVPRRDESDGDSVYEYLEHHRGPLTMSASTFLPLLRACVSARFQLAGFFAVRILMQISPRACVSHLCGGVLRQSQHFQSALVAVALAGVAEAAMNNAIDAHSVPGWAVDIVAFMGALGDECEALLDATTPEKNSMMSKWLDSLNLALDVAHHIAGLGGGLHLVRGENLAPQHVDSDGTSFGMSGSRATPHPAADPSVAVNDSLTKEDGGYASVSDPFPQCGGGLTVCRRLITTLSRHRTMRCALSSQDDNGGGEEPEMAIVARIVKLVHPLTLIPPDVPETLFATPLPRDPVCPPSHHVAGGAERVQQMEHAIAKLTTALTELGVAEEMEAGTPAEHALRRSAPALPPLSDEAKSTDRIDCVRRALCHVLTVYELRLLLECASNAATLFCVNDSSIRSSSAIVCAGVAALAELDLQQGMSRPLNTILECMSNALRGLSPILAVADAVGAVGFVVARLDRRADIEPSVLSSGILLATCTAFSTIFDVVEPLILPCRVLRHEVAPLSSQRGGLGKSKSATLAMSTGGGGTMVSRSSLESTVQWTSKAVLIGLDKAAALHHLATEVHSIEQALLRLQLVIRDYIGSLASEDTFANIMRVIAGDNSSSGLPARRQSGVLQQGGVEDGLIGPARAAAPFDPHQSVEFGEPPAASVYRKRSLFGPKADSASKPQETELLRILAYLCGRGLGSSSAGEPDPVRERGIVALLAMIRFGALRETGVESRVVESGRSGARSSDRSLLWCLRALRCAAELGPDVRAAISSAGGVESALTALDPLVGVAFRALRGALGGETAPVSLTVAAPVVSTAAQSDVVVAAVVQSFLLHNMRSVASDTRSASSGSPVTQTALRRHQMDSDGSGHISSGAAAALKAPPVSVLGALTAATAALCGDEGLAAQWLDPHDRVNTNSTAAQPHSAALGLSRRPRARSVTAHSGEPEGKGQSLHSIFSPSLAQPTRDVARVALALATLLSRSHYKATSPLLQEAIDEASDVSAERVVPPASRFSLHTSLVLAVVTRYMTRVVLQHAGLALCCAACLRELTARLGISLQSSCDIAHLLLRRASRGPVMFVADTRPSPALAPASSKDASAAPDSQRLTTALTAPAEQSPESLLIAALCLQAEALDTLSSGLLHVIAVASTQLTPPSGGGGGGGGGTQPPNSNPAFARRLSAVGRRASFSRGSTAMTPTNTMTTATAASLAALAAHTVALVLRLPFALVRGVVASSQPVDDHTSQRALIPLVRFVITPPLIARSVSVALNACDASVAAAVAACRAFVGTASAEHIRLPPTGGTASGSPRHHADEGVRRRKQSFSSLAGVVMPRETDDSGVRSSGALTALEIHKTPPLTRALGSAMVCCGALVANFTSDALAHSSAAAALDRDEIDSSVRVTGDKTTLLLDNNADDLLSIASLAETMTAIRCAAGLSAAELPEGSLDVPAIAVHESLLLTLTRQLLSRHEQRLCFAQYAALHRLRRQHDALYKMMLDPDATGRQVTSTVGEGTLPQGTLESTTNGSGEEKGLLHQPDAEGTLGFGLAAAQLVASLRVTLHWQAIMYCVDEERREREHLREAEEGDAQRMLTSFGEGVRVIKKAEGRRDRLHLVEAETDSRSVLSADQAQHLEPLQQLSARLRALHDALWHLAVNREVRGRAAILGEWDVRVRNWGSLVADEIAERLAIQRRAFSRLQQLTARTTPKSRTRNTAALHNNSYRLVGTSFDNAEAEAQTPPKKTTTVVHAASQAVDTDFELHHTPVPPSQPIAAADNCRPPATLRVLRYDAVAHFKSAAGSRPSSAGANRRLIINAAATPMDSQRRSRPLSASLMKIELADSRSRTVPVTDSVAHPVDHHLCFVPRHPSRSPSPRSPRGPRPCIGDICEAVKRAADDADGGVDIDLSQHYIGDAAILDGVAAALLSLRWTLVRLHLPRNGITTASIPALVLDALVFCEHLEYVDLSDNRGITATAGRYLVRFVKGRPSLLQLRLEGTQLFSATLAIIEGVLQERRALLNTPPVVALSGS